MQPQRELPAFARLWHHRATTGSDGGFAIVMGARVHELPLKAEQEFVMVAQRKLDRAVSARRLALSAAALDKWTAFSEGMAVRAIAHSDEVCVVLKAVRRDPITRSTRILGDPEDWPCEQIERVVFVALPPPPEDAASVAARLAAADRDSPGDRVGGRFARFWRLAVLAKRHTSLLRTGQRADTHRDAEEKRTAQAAVVAGETKTHAAAVAALRAERASLLDDLALCKYQPVEGGVARVLFDDEKMEDPRREAMSVLRRPDPSQDGPPRIGPECLAAAAGTLRCLRQGPALGPYPGEMVDEQPGFRSAMSEYARLDAARREFRVAKAWANAPPIRRVPSHFNQTLQESACLVERILAEASPERRATMQAAMRQVEEHQRLLQRRLRAITALCSEAKHVLRHEPCLLLALLLNPDTTGVLADALDASTAIRLRRTCRGFRSCDAVAKRIPHVIFNTEGWGDKNNALLFNISTVFGTETQTDRDLVAANRYFTQTPKLHVVLLYDAPGLPRVANVSGGCPIALQCNSNHAEGASVWSGCMRGDAWATAPQIKIRAGVSSYADRGQFAAELQAAVDAAPNECARLEARRMRDRNAQKQHFRLQVHFRATSRTGQQVEQMCLSPPFTVGKKRAAPATERRSRAKVRG